MLCRILRAVLAGSSSFVSFICYTDEICCISLAKVIVGLHLLLDFKTIVLAVAVCFYYTCCVVVLCSLWSVFSRVQ